MNTLKVTLFIDGTTFTLHCAALLQYPLVMSQLWISNCPRLALFTNPLHIAMACYHGGGRGVGTEGDSGWTRALCTQCQQRMQGKVKYPHTGSAKGKTYHP